MDLSGIDVMGMVSLLLFMSMVFPVSETAIAALPPSQIEVSAAIKATPIRFTEVEVQRRLRDLPGWTTDGEALFYERTFPDFVSAIAFVNELVAPAEALAHHPDITIQYNRVFLTLTTHDAGGLTELDFALATAINQL
jgi:4a-hydroxytetrahydrobiopterin dehydratase